MPTSPFASDNVQGATAVPRSAVPQVSVGLLLGKKSVRAEELDHVAVEQPGLFDLAGMPGARQHFQVAIPDALLQCERGVVR
jgi:hypothetical protein